MEKVWLHNNKGFPWFKTEKIRAKGCFFDRAGNLWSGENLPRYFEGIRSSSDFLERVSYANGIFSIVMDLDGERVAATDPYRSFPLFYTVRKDDRSISDDPYLLSLTKGLTGEDKSALAEFLATGYVTGNYTLTDGIRQIQAGEMIRFNDGEPGTKFYHSYRCQTVREESYPELREEAKKVFALSFPRLIASLEGKTAIVPLSGGYDSRLVASMLKYYGYGKVICFSYGRKNNSDAVIARQVAEKLGFPWIFVEYSKHLIRDFIKTNNFLDFVQYSARMTSMIPIQEYFAVKHLKEENLVPADSVFIPGHYGNFLAGGMLYKYGNLSLEESVSQIAQRILYQKYIYKKPRRREIRIINDRIEKRIQEKFVKDSDLSYSIHEDFDFKERYAKIIANSCSVYTFFGYEFRLPLCDLDMTDFFRRLPLHAKVNKYLYDDILANDIFSRYDINFNHEGKTSEKIIERARRRNRIRTLFPERIRRIMTSGRDRLFMREITSCLREDISQKGMKIKIYGESWNSLIVQWYAYSVQRFLRHGKSK